MRKLRKRQIAKQYGIRYKRFSNDFHLFKSKSERWTIGFFFCNSETFLNMVKNQDKWLDFNFKKRK